ncbi:MAG: NADH-quinone oxidoreductase subunit M [Thermodesulfovibrionales bacterium]|nr:NADH-quinone oxidoreductase subunit M [Thermodesulfovibrionales bacterium]
MLEKTYLLVIIPILGALLLRLTERRNLLLIIALLSSLATLLFSIFQYLSLNRASKGFQFVWDYMWISSWDVNISFGLDIINAPFVVLSCFITLISILLSFKTIEKRLSLYLSLLLSLSATVNAYFLSNNLLLFFFFYEAMLIPSIFLIKLWGAENSSRASMKFMLYTFGFSIFLFIAIIAVYSYGGSFSFDKLLNLKLTLEGKVLIFISFFLAFAVKIPVVPFHGWLRDAYYEAPMPVTIFMSAILGKMGIYGLLRVAPAFTEVLDRLGEWFIAICLLSFVYAAFVALTEKDIKAMLAYMSLSHVGIITAGVFTGNIYGYQGSLLQSINHGILAAAFFYVADLLYRNTYSFDSDKFGALSKKIPAITFFSFAYIMAMGGFPGLNYFNGEFLLLSSIFSENLLLGFFGVLGIAVGVIYLSWFFYKIFLRKPQRELSLLVRDVQSWELIILSIIFALTIYLGLNPDLVLEGLKGIEITGGRG